MDCVKPLSCVICNKCYTKKSSLEKHKLVCEFKMKTARERQIEMEELGDVPTHLQLVKIVQELTMKLTRAEKQIEEMKKWTDKKKKKVNVILWLNNNIIPTLGFLEWTHTSLTVTSIHFENLMEKDISIYGVIQQIFEHNLSTTLDFVYPIRCFTEKPGVFYIYDKKSDITGEWTKVELSDMLLMLKRIQNGLIKELTLWQSVNKHKMEDNDRLAILYQQTIQKLFSISFCQDNNFSRMKNSLYNYLKTDLKSVEFEYEF